MNEYTATVIGYICTAIVIIVACVCLTYSCHSGNEVRKIEAQSQTGKP